MADLILQYYTLLELAPGASKGEIERAYRDLIKVWHPDRFLHDPRLQQKALEKAKKLNEAYEALRSYKGPTPREARPRREAHMGAGKHCSENFRAQSRQRPMEDDLTYDWSEESFKAKRSWRRLWGGCCARWIAGSWNLGLRLAKAAAVIAITVLAIDIFSRYVNDVKPAGVLNAVTEAIRDIASKGKQPGDTPYDILSRMMRPDDVKGGVRLAAAYSRFGRHGVAVKILRRSVLHDPYDTDAYFNLGLAYDALRRELRALEAYGRAVQLSPNDARARFHLGLSYLRIGDLASAAEEQGTLGKLDGALAHRLQQEMRARRDHRIEHLEQLLDETYTPAGAGLIRMDAMAGASD